MTVNSGLVETNGIRIIKTMIVCLTCFEIVLIMLFYSTKLNLYRLKTDTT